MLPNRLLRDGLMESEAVLSLPVEGRWLFVIIILSADDLGLFEATEFKLARRADVKREHASKLLAMVADADLVRLYEVERKRYGFIPKFRQRVQIKAARYPLPPPALYADDPDAVNKFKHLASKTTVGAPVGSSCTSDGQPPEVEVEVEEQPVSVVPAVLPRRRRKAADRVPACPIESIVQVYHEILPELPAVRVLHTAGGKRERTIRGFWRWVLTSTKRGDGARRATSTEQGLQWIRDYFTRARDSDWIMGREQRGPGHESWEAGLEYLCSEAGLKRVIEKTRDRA